MNAQEQVPGWVTFEKGIAGAGDKPAEQSAPDPLNALRKIHFLMNGNEVVEAERLAALAHATAILNGEHEKRERHTIDALVPFVDDYACALNKRVSDNWNELESRLVELELHFRGREQSPLDALVRMLAITSSDAYRSDAESEFISLGNSLGLWARSEPLFAQALSAWRDWLARHGLACEIRAGSFRGHCLVPWPKHPTLDEALATSNATKSTAPSKATTATERSKARMIARSARRIAAEAAAAKERRAR